MRRALLLLPWPLVALLLPAPPADGDCPGCPPAAWQVEIDLASGRSLRGMVAIHPELVRESIVFEEHEGGFQPPVEWENHGQPVEIWQDWRYADTSPIEGWTMSRRTSPEAEPKPGRLRLPRSVILVGDPIRVPTGDIVRITDDSHDGPGTRSFRQTRLGVRWAPLLDREPELAVMVLINDNELFCFSFERSLTVAQLVDECHEGAASCEGLLVLFYDAGD